jgi:hypothetical protein
MEYDKTRAEEKRKELATLVTDALRPDAGDEAAVLAAEVVAHFARVTAPEAEPRAVGYLELEVRDDGQGGATSTKPGNVVLNWGKLWMAIGSGSLTITGTLGVPWKLIVGALVTWNSLYKSLQVEISEAHACVLWALWNNKDDRRTVAKKDVHRKVNRERSKLGRPPMSPQEIDDALTVLVRMRCIKQSRVDPTRWWLRERVRATYR